MHKRAPFTFARGRWSATDWGGLCRCRGPVRARMPVPLASGCTIRPRGPWSWRRFCTSASASTRL